MKSAIVSGSFDPITVGHVWLVEEALKLAETVHVVVAHNPDKKYMFNQVERFQHVVETFEHRLQRVEVRLLPPKTMLVDYAREFNCHTIVRGLRDSSDLEYERRIDLVQRKVNADVQTLYVMTPPDLNEVSSTMVRGLAGLKGWELVVSEYVPHPVLVALRAKVNTA